MEIIVIELETCCGCPFFETGMGYSLDGWDTVFDWYCKKAKKKTAEAVEWNDKPPIPEWCPAKLENYEKAKT